MNITYKRLPPPAPPPPPPDIEVTMSLSIEEAWSLRNVLAELPSGNNGYDTAYQLYTTVTAAIMKVEDRL